MTDIESKEKIESQLLPLKVKYYNKEDILYVLKRLEENAHPQEIASEQEIFSARQIKMIRFIDKKGTEQEKEILFSGEYYISRIKKYIQEKKKKIKKSQDAKTKNKKR